MQSRFDGPQGHVERVGDGLQIQPVDEAQQDDFLLHVRQSDQEVRHVSRPFRGRGGVQLRVERRLTAGSLATGDREMLHDRIEKRLHLAAQFEVAAAAEEIGEGFLEDVERVLAVRGEPEGERRHPLVVAVVEGFEGGRVSVAQRSRQFGVGPRIHDLIIDAPGGPGPYNGSVDSPENIPLQEAVDRGIIPCVSCGAKGADVQRVGAKDHLLCAKCARGGTTWIWILAGLTFAVVALVFLLLRMRTPEDHRPPPSSLPANARDPEPWMKETLRLMEMKRYADARVRIQELLEPLPQQPELNLLMGRCLMSLRYYDGAIPYLMTAYNAGGAFRDEAGLRLGLSFKTIGHAREALPFLEKPWGGDGNVRGELAEVYLDLERYEDALKSLPDASDHGSLWARHRALVYLGRREEAQKLLEGLDDDEVASLRAGLLREDGDFDGARKIIQAQLEKAQPHGSLWNQLCRSERSLAIESGDLAGLDTVAAEFSDDKDLHLQAEAAYTHALSALLHGQREPAKAAAWEFLAKCDKEFSPLRLERMMMRHLVGELKDADLDAESKVLSRFHANDLLWYLAVVTGDRALAEAALASTPGHNYPYHAIQRLLKK